MKILAIDTSTEACSAALLHKEQIVQRHTLAVRQHAQLILPMIEEILEEANISLLQLDAIAFGRGPGSFTGLRIAASVTQGLALAHDLPVIAISSLQTLAQIAWHKFNATKVLTAIDARMQQVYWGEYQLQNGIMQLIGDEQVISPENLMTVTEDKYFAIGSGWARYDILSTQFAGKIYSVAGDHYPLAQDMLSIAEVYFQQGKLMSAEQVEPVYIRNKVTQ